MLDYSEVRFESVGPQEFAISVFGTQSLVEECEMCWSPLFTYTVIASGFPVPPRTCNEKGMELPFDVMLRLARTTYAVTYDGGLVLSGFFTLLFPSGHWETCDTSLDAYSHSVQWHLITSKDDHTRISVGVELARHYHLWVKIGDEELLRSARTFLGHCRAARVHLGTKNSGFSNISASSLTDDKPNPVISVRSGNMGTSGMGIFGAAINAEIILPRALARMTRIDYYNDILWTAKNMPVLLYDADQQQAWLVPALSVILHMAHAWVAIHAPDIQLPYAELDWNGGQAAWDVIAKSGRLELQRSLEDDTPYFLKDLVKRLWEHLVSCLDSTTLDRGTIETGHPKLRGWEYTDIIHPPVRSRMKEQILDRKGCGWEKLTEDVLLLVCKGLGEVIQPAQPSSLCAELYPVQRGNKYLTASVACLRQLSKNNGMGETCTKLGDRVFWRPPPPTLFEDCSHGIGQPCHKEPQQLVDDEGCGSTKVVPAEAAVLFGRKTRKLKKKMPKSLAKKSEIPMANGYIVESTKQNAVVNVEQLRSVGNSLPLTQGEPTVLSSQAVHIEGFPGCSSLAFAHEQCAGAFNQEMVNQITPRKSVNPIPKAKDDFISNSLSPFGDRPCMSENILPHR